MVPESTKNHEGTLERAAIQKSSTFQGIYFNSQRVTWGTPSSFSPAVTR